MALKKQIKGKITKIGYREKSWYGKDRKEVYIETETIYNRVDTVEEAERALKRLQKILGSEVVLFTT